tara:strand:+ start:468 stop:770 length:303 start_codon:yes stop_codon:yes gene_type:complete
MNDTYDGAAPSPPQYEQEGCIHVHNVCIEYNTTSTYFAPSVTPPQIDLINQPKTYSDDQLIAAFDQWCRQVNTAQSLSAVTSLLEDRSKVIPINRSPKEN